MSRKTKKQKIAAERHRLVNATVSIPDDQRTISYQIKRPVEFSPVKLAGTVNSVEHKDQEHLTGFEYLYSDLKRIVVLTALAFCAQIVLWYILNRG